MYYSNQNDSKLALLFLLFTHLHEEKDQSKKGVTVTFTEDDIKMFEDENYIIENLPKISIIEHAIFNKEKNYIKACLGLRRSIGDIFGGYKNGL